MVVNEIFTVSLRSNWDIREEVKFTKDTITHSHGAGECRLRNSHGKEHRTGLVLNALRNKEPLIGTDAEQGRRVKSRTHTMKENVLGHVRSLQGLQIFL